MTGLLFHQLERLKTERGKKLLSEVRLEAGKIIIVSSPPVPNDGLIKVDFGEHHTPKVTVRRLK